MRPHLLASLVLAPSLVACASAGAVAPAPVSVELERTSSTPTTVFLETAGMELTPPAVCDPVVAGEALDRGYDDREALRPACESACRVDTCRSMAVRAEVMGAMYYDEFNHVMPQLVAHCEATIEGCAGVVGVVTFDESFESLGLEVPEYDYEELDVEVEESPTPADPAVEAACDEGDAAACYALVDLDLVLQGWDAWQQPLRDASLERWQRACDLEPMVYCGGLELAIEYTTDEGCGG